VPDNFNELVKEWKKKKISLADILKVCDMSEATFYRRVREYGFLKHK